MCAKKKESPELLKSQLNNSVNSIRDAFIENINSSLADLPFDSAQPLKLQIVLKTEGIGSQATLTYGRDKDGVCGFWPRGVWVGACLQ